MTKILTQDVMDYLILAGEKYGCELQLPPFLGRRHPFYALGDITERTLDFRNFLIRVKAIGVDYKFVKHNGEDFLEIIGKEDENVAENGAG